MLEKIKEWFISDTSVWFFLGWTLNELLTKPSLINLLIVAFWVWVLTLDE